MFLACAGVGAYIAAHSDPFPPGVDRPGASPMASASPSGPPACRSGGSGASGASRTTSCTSEADAPPAGAADLRFTVDAETGAVEGAGAARLFGELECDFPIAQVQAERVELAMTGRLQRRDI